jgi:hypothetical protein
MKDPILFSFNHSYTLPLKRLYTFQLQSLVRHGSISLAGSWKYGAVLQLYTL